MSAGSDQDIPTIVHDKARKEYRLTLPNLADQNKVRLIAVSYQMYNRKINRFRKLAYAVQGYRTVEMT